MSNGMAPESRLGSSAKAKLARRSMNFLINHADETRSIPGRGRVTQVRPMKFFFRFVVGEAGRLGVSAARARRVSTLLRSGLWKKSIAITSWNWRRRRARTGVFLFAEEIFLMALIKA